MALQQGHDRVISLLLERDSRGKSRLPALHIAAKKDDVHAAKLLLNNSEINVDHTSAVSAFCRYYVLFYTPNKDDFDCVINIIIKLPVIDIILSLFIEEE